MASSPQHLKQCGHRIAVVGGGVIGLSVALELRRRRMDVEVFEAASVFTRRPGQASFAAAGMLSPGDPDRPPALRLFAEESLRQYDNFLREIKNASGIAVPYQTEVTLEYAADGSTRVLAERSLDPRQLHHALETAVAAQGVPIHRGAPVASASEGADGVALHFADRSPELFAGVVFAGGAWMDAHALRPRKGQMLRVAIPAGLQMDRVYRAHDVYIVPRTTGPQQGSAVIGATVEDCGFDLRVDPVALGELRQRAARLVPAFGDATAAPEVEHWAGLRPCTRDDLPLLGAAPGATRQWIAAGHFRDGILLAPGTAIAIADLVEGRSPAVDLAPFAPGRFAQRDR